MLQYHTAHLPTTCCGRIKKSALLNLLSLLYPVPHQPQIFRWKYDHDREIQSRSSALSSVNSDRNMVMAKKGIKSDRSKRILRNISDFAGKGRNEREKVSMMAVIESPILICCVCNLSTLSPAVYMPWVVAWVCLLRV